MAASAWETSSSQCCSSTNCACGDRGRWNNSSLLSKRLSEDSGRHQLLQKWANMWSTVSRDSSNGGDGERPRRQEAGAAPAGAAAAEAEATVEATALAAAAEEEEEAERLLVFLCGGCRRPLGDSLSWVTSQEDSNCILLRSVSANVSVNKEQILSKRKNENGCILEALYCTGCSLSLGFIYKYTPKALDYKRDLFCLSVEAIESYILGSSEKQIVSEDKELFNLESRVEIEKSLKEMEDVLKALEMKLWEVESKLSFSSCCKS